MCIDQAQDISIKDSRIQTFAPLCGKVNSIDIRNSNVAIENSSIGLHQSNSSSSADLYNIFLSGKTKITLKDTPSLLNSRSTQDRLEYFGISGDHLPKLIVLRNNTYIAEWPNSRKLNNDLPKTNTRSYLTVEKNGLDRPYPSLGNARSFGKRISKFFSANSTKHF